MLALHGTQRDTLPLHSGLCLVVGPGAECAARDYADGGNLFEVEVDLDGLVVLDIDTDPRECWDENTWPGDSARERAEYVASGVDAIRYLDATARGREHTTLRLLSERALAAVTLLTE